VLRGARLEAAALSGLAAAKRTGPTETRVGKASAGRRKEPFLTTKLEPREAKEASRMVEGSLHRLKVDQVDLIPIHSLNSEEELAAILENTTPSGLLRQEFSWRICRIGV
jgi:diketogulonate reductase-like aldo/keto reductase